MPDLSSKQPLDNGDDPTPIRSPNPNRLRPILFSAMATAFTIFALVGFWVASHVKGYQDWNSPGMGGMIAIFLWAIVLGYGRPSRAVAIGALIGLGVALLVEGACFALKR